MLNVRQHAATGVVPFRPHLWDRGPGEASGRPAAAVVSATPARSTRPRKPPYTRAASPVQGSADSCALGSHHGQPRSWPRADPPVATADRRHSVAGQHVLPQPRRRGGRWNRMEPLDRTSTSASGHRADRLAGTGLPVTVRPSAGPARRPFDVAPEQCHPSGRPRAVRRFGRRRVAARVEVETAALRSEDSFDQDSAAAIWFESRWGH